jgi:hypothetical protein
VKSAFEMTRAAEPQTIENQLRICAVEAPPFKEAKRAEVYARIFREAGFEGMKRCTGNGVGTNWMDLGNGKPLSVFWKKGRGRQASPDRPGD